MKILVGLLLSAMLFSQMGCVAAAVGAAAGAGAVVYLKGNLEETMSHGTPEVYRATLAALNDLKVPVIKDDHDNVNVSLESRFADNTTVWIWIDGISPTSSKLKIRVGTFGEENRSRLILEKVHLNLKKTPPTAPAQPNQAPGQPRSTM